MSNRKSWPYIALSMALVALTAIVYIYSPTLRVRGIEAEEIFLLSALPVPTLWEIGFDPDDTKLPDWDWAEDLYPGTHAELIDDALRRVREAATGTAHARYLLAEPKMTSAGLYALSIRGPEGQVLYLKVMSWEDEAAGRFVGYMHSGGASNGNIRWFAYRNPIMGRVLKDLRSL